jgi:hypothetical protein
MLRFVDGFDHYAVADVLTKWSTGVGVTSSGLAISTSFGRNGSGGARFSDSYSIVKQIDSQASWVIGFGFRCAALPSSGSRILCALMDSLTNQVELRLNATGTLSVTSNGNSLSGGTSTITLTAGVYYYLELKATIATSISSGTCKVSVGGVNAITVTAGANTRQGTSNASANGVSIGPQAGGGGISHDYDDFYACDSQGSTNTDLLGDVRVETIFPTGAGNSTNMTPNTGSNYAAVNQTAQDGDTTYVATPTATTKDTYAMGDLSSSPASVKGVQIAVTARKDDAGTRTVASVVRSGGADYDATAQALADTYAMLLDVRETNPDGSVAWTGTTVNTMEAGVKLVS